MQPTRVLCVYMGTSRTPNACEIYRGNLPLHFLGQQIGWETNWLFFDDLFALYARQGISAIVNVVAENDVFVFPRAFIPSGDEQFKVGFSTFLTIIRSAGKRIVYEVDDDYTNEYRRVCNGDSITPASWSDAVTVTTPFLAETMGKHTNRPVYVLPNCIDADTWRGGAAPERTDEMRGKVIIGLTGSPTHFGDWMVFAPIMRDLLTNNPQLHLVIGGFQPDYLSGLPSTTYIPYLDYIRYSQVIRGCDIIIASVNPLDPFNIGKSPLKALEGQAAERKLPTGTPAGAAVIATDHPIYRLAIQNGKTGILVDQTPQAWREAIQKLIDDKAYRQELQVKGFSWVYKHHDINREWRQWAKAYQRILKAPYNPLPLPL